MSQNPKRFQEIISFHTVTEMTETNARAKPKKRTFAHLTDIKQTKHEIQKFIIDSFNISCHDSM